MKESPPLSAEELEAAKRHFEKNPWIGKTHLGRMSQPCTASVGTAKSNAAVPARRASDATRIAR